MQNKQYLSALGITLYIAITPQKPLCSYFSFYYICILINNKYINVMDEKIVKVVNQVKDYLEEHRPDDYETVINIADDIREMIREIDHDQVWAVDEDFAPNLINQPNNWRSAFLIGDNNDGVEYDARKFMATDGEQDVTLVHLVFNPAWGDEKPTMEQIALSVVQVFAWFDCTGCCDAIYVVNLNSDGLFFYIQSAVTMHS